jgi:metallo-beta-lactamase family protein
VTRLTFLGAAGTVTGSRFLLETDSRRVLVDCGLFQGLKVLRLRNWAPFPVDPASIDAVILTHAHLDHSGYLPALVRDGFSGPIHCTAATADLTPILLADSGRLQEEDAEYANRKGFSRHRPALPLYTEEDAVRASERLAGHGWDEAIDAGGARFRFRYAGHILGAASVESGADDLRILFSGDLGRPHDPLMRAAAAPPAADHVVMESTYGDHAHAEADPLGSLAEVARRTIARGGVLLIPAFAVGRSQTLILLLNQLFEAGAIPRVPLFLNSPMAIDVTTLYHRHAADHRLTSEQSVAALRSVEPVETADESKVLNRRRGPMIIIAGAGMITGGRILHHLRAFGDDPRTTILLAGHQAAGTRGAQLLAGARSLRIHGRDVPIRAEVARLEGLSGHADQPELLQWLASAPAPPRSVYLVHGEPEPLDALRQRIEHSLRIPAHVAEHEQSISLEAARVAPGVPAAQP